MAFGIERIYKKKTTTVHYFDQKEIENGNRLDECYVLVIRCTTATIAIQVHFYFILFFFHYARVIGSFLLEHYSGRPTDWLLTPSMKPQKVNTHRVETIKKLPERRYLILGEFYHN